MKAVLQPRIIFITGTDTGVGKTVLTALLLSHLRQAAVPAFALKPFCSGGRADAELLHSLQEGDLTLDEINPYHFAEPLAPLVAARAHNRQIRMDDIAGHIRSILSHFSKIENQKSKIENPTLLIEGAGGLLAPLGENFNLLDLILATSSVQIIVVAPNRLGTINHTLLTVRVLQSRNLRVLRVVLMDVFPPQHSTPDTHSNPSILAELLSSIPLFRIPYLRKNPSKPGQIQQFAKKYKKTLAQILA